MRGSVGSYASSNVIPLGPADFYLEEGETASDEEGSPDMADSRQLEPKPLVRQASLGKRVKATLTRVDEKSEPRASPPNGDRQAMTGTPVADSLGSERSILLDASDAPSSSDEEFEKPRMAKEVVGKSANASKTSGGRTQPGTKAPQALKPTARSKPSSSPLAYDSSVEQILGGLEKGGALDPTAANQLRRPPKSGISERAGRRPPRINVEAVREAEARGSITSLPDLIRRATRLASNLDRGKTASRLGMDWAFDDAGRARGNASNDRLANIDEHGRASGGSLADMINAFPNPGISTPDRRSTPPGQGAWPSAPSSQRPLNSRREYYEKGRPARRRCCGMPLWMFILVLFIVLLLVAAAVVIPIVLIVLPRINSHKTATTPASQQTQCESLNPCENGGTVTVLSDGTCSCVCMNGFTGPRCLNTADAGCTASPVAGMKNNATMGTEIAGLLAEAQSKYGVPLDGQTILSVFAQNNFSCGSENALVTFNGVPGHLGQRDVVPKEPLPAYVVVTRVIQEMRKRGTFNRRQAGSSSGSGSGSLVTDSSTSSQPTNTLSIETAVVATASTLVSALPHAAASAAVPGTNSTAQDFAKVGILLVLQTSLNLTAAGQAQQNVGSFLQYAVKEGVGVDVAMNVSLGAGTVIDLVDLTVTLKNGTVFGRGGAGTSPVAAAGNATGNATGAGR